MNEKNIMYNELISVFDKIAKKMNLDFQNGFLDDVFETDYCITRVDLPECSDDEIETCKMDWIHSKKDDFIYSVICELYPNVNHSNENYYEKFYDECFQYLIDKTFKNSSIKENYIMKYKVVDLEKTIEEKNIKKVDIDDIMNLYYYFYKDDNIGSYDMNTLLSEGYYYAQLEENYYTMCSFFSGELYIHDFNNLLDGIKWLVDDESYDESSILSDC